MMRIRILHTNDIHSNYENFARIVTKLNELRDENTLVLDAGDFADFKRIELQGTDGKAALELLEYAGYDAITIGNNETFNGLDTLVNMATNSKAVFLSSNTFQLDRQEIEGVRRSTIIQKAGLRILVVGASPDLGEFSTLGGFYIRNYMEAISEEIKANEGKFDLCILLSHLGMDKDKLLAEGIPALDVVIGGHFHILMDKAETINKTHIFTSGCFGEHLGMLELESVNGKIDILESMNINTLECMPDEGIIDILRRNKSVAIEKLSQPLYRLERDLWHDVIEENPITNLLADALVDVLDCEVGIINSGIVNGGIRKGEVSIKKLLEICPSPLNPTYVEIKGRHIREALQDSLDSDFCLSDGRGPGFRGKYLGKLQVSSNMRIHHDKRIIKEIHINDVELDDEKWYSVATSDYLQRGTGYASLKHNKNEKYNAEYIREVLCEYINRKEFVDRAFESRWVLE